LIFFFFFRLKIDAETRAQQKLVSEQITRLEKREQELIKREEALILEKRSLNELKQRLDVDQSTMKTQQEELKQKLIDIEHANELIKKDKERLSQLYYELHALDGKSTGKLQQLQKSISNLRQQEEHMNEVNHFLHIYKNKIFRIFFAAIFSYG
jgi:myosin heavy subunit